MKVHKLDSIVGLGSSNVVALTGGLQPTEPEVLALVTYAGTTNTVIVEGRMNGTDEWVILDTFDQTQIGNTAFNGTAESVNKKYFRLPAMPSMRVSTIAGSPAATTVYILEY